MLMCNSLLIQYLQIYSNYCTTYFHQLIFFFSRASYSFKLYKKGVFPAPFNRLQNGESQKTLHSIICSCTKRA
ncbi:hypothetical protein EQH20_06955 [Streptococcus pneumoniae]|nr:hypothetical protein EQH20_06955 [Streptococcus pneumoniae]